VPEAIAAHALGAEVMALSLPTNWAAGITEGKLSHAEVVAAGEAAAPRCAALLAGILDRL
jgi:purine-nucleoside phosphorylase